MVSIRFLSPSLSLHMLLRTHARSSSVTSLAVILRLQAPRFAKERATMRAEIFAYMIYLEGHEYVEYLMHIVYLEYSGTPDMAMR